MTATATIPCTPHPSTMPSSFRHLSETVRTRPNLPTLPTPLLSPPQAVFLPITNNNLTNRARSRSCVFPRPTLLFHPQFHRPKAHIHQVPTRTPILLSTTMSKSRASPLRPAQRTPSSSRTTPQSCARTTRMRRTKAKGRLRCSIRIMHKRYIIDSSVSRRTTVATKARNQIIRARAR